MLKPSPVVVDTADSPYAKLKPVPISAVRLEDSFWAPRREINRRATLRSQYEQCEKTGRIDNFRRASGRKQGEFQGIFFNDSDVYKWLEAVAWELGDARRLKPPLRDSAMARLADTVADEIAAAQQPNGYLNSYFMFERAKDRFTNLKDMHELYCAGHFMQAAVAHWRGTGSEKLLDVARRLADHICSLFGPGKRAGACGHEEIEMAMVELGRATGERKYIEQARFFIDIRGRGHIGGNSYHQDHKPFVELDRMTGHAVRATYYAAGAADVYAETGDPAYRAALDRLWENMTGRQMYITGGIGQRHEGEAFGNDYELPNERAYAETCAAIAVVFWAWRMLMLEGDAKYADVMERALYNGVLSGLSLDGQSYFYVNPLADDGGHRRQAWFGCACCPPNLSRLMSSLPGYFYSTSARAVWIHLYAAGGVTATLPDGRQVELAVETKYPWEGRVRVQVRTAGRFELRLRVPGWCEGARVDGVAAPAGSYARIDRAWKKGDVVEVDLPMTVRRVECHPHVVENAGRVAMMRGPLVYCLEGVDHPGVELREVVVESVVGPQWRDDLLGGVMVVKGRGRVERAARWEGGLYREAGFVVQPLGSSGGEQAKACTTNLCWVPYYAWANREAGQMAVWVRRA